MGEALTKEEYLALSEEERMRARLIGLQQHLASARGAGAVRRRVVPPAGGASVETLSLDGGEAEAGKAKPAVPRGQAKFEWRTMMKPSAASRTWSVHQVSRAADEAGITQEQAERFLQELEKKSAG